MSMLRRVLCTLLLFGACAQAQQIESGLWYDRTHSGHGLDLHRAGDTLFGTLYTYEFTGPPRWLWIQMADVAAPSGNLTRYNRLPDGSLAATVETTIELTPVSECPDGIARDGARALLRMDFALEGRALVWCMEPLLPQAPVAASALSGAWYNPDEPGWGLFVHAWRSANGTEFSYRTIYFHDAEGDPRWAFAQDPITGLTQQQLYYTPYTECFTCSPSPPLTIPIGGATLTLTSPDPAANYDLNRINLSLSIDGDPPFERDVALALLSDPRVVATAAATRQGPVSGVEVAPGISSFRKIPFAQPPVDQLRWRAPQPPEIRSQALDGTVFGPGCPQPPGAGFFNGAPATQSEDCLQLNVWRPAGAGPFPVMVWIHGGGLTQGSAVQLSGGELFYDGARLAELGVVLVSLNYRLGPLGYLAQRDLVAEAPDHPRSGNYGLLDQIQALRWIGENIGYFGGDNRNITIFGESAGALSVCALLTAPAAQGLFQRAISQSGHCSRTSPSLNQALQQGDRVSAALGCDGAPDRLACLRAVDAQTLIAEINPVISTGLASDGESFGLINDGFVLPTSPGLALAGGAAAAVPLLIGVNDDEQTTLTPANLLPATVAGYEAAIRNLLPQIGSLVLQIYAAAGYSSPQAAYQDLLDDLRFTCANRRAAADHAAAGNPVYAYVLTEVLPDLAALESFHGLDVVLLFANRQQAQAGEILLRDRIRRAWVDFAYALPPGNTEGLAWPLYDSDQRLSLELSSTRRFVFEDYRQLYCEFWNQFVTL